MSDVCTSCPFSDECENPLKGIEHCTEGMRTFKFGQGCWDDKDPESYVSCSECFHSLKGFEVCKAVRADGEFVLTFREKGDEKNE